MGKEGNEKIEEKLKQYQFMVESAHNAIFFKDLKSRYIIANNKTLGAFGLSGKKIIGKNDYELIPNKEEAKKNIEEDQIVFKTNKPTEITRHMTGTDGKEYWFQTIKVPQFDNNGKIIGLVGITRDITERKKAEEKIRKSAEEWRKTFDTIFDFIFLLDKDFKFVKVNKAICDFLKKEPKDLIGKKCYRVIHNTNKPCLGCPNKKTLITKKTVTGEIINSNLGLSLLITTSPVFDDGGKLMGSIHIAKDITERKKAEEELKKRTEELEKFNQFTIDRELKMVELKKEINELCKKLEEKPRYSVK